MPISSIEDPINQTIKRLLIANRGEVSSRITRTAKELGIKTIAIYSSDDRDLPFTSVADEAYLLSTNADSLAETYLDQERIIEIAKNSQADAIHPGYGFLAENADFAEKVLANGIKWIGPLPSTLQVMGDKGTAKKIAADAGVPVIPSICISDLDHPPLEMDYPIILKASWGGGGIGQRVVNSAQEFTEALQRVKSEAQRAVGHSEIIIEKYLQQVRHIEVQIISDKFGNHRHLMERECSIQRRRQKVLEEAPAPSLQSKSSETLSSSDLREKILNSAVKIARACNYLGVGTVEFLVDSADNFYFMEMNPRLQVEHAVTEMIMGIDLVEWQLRIASGNTLPWTQDELMDQERGHAIEVRLYAEDPTQNFMPACGEIKQIATNKDTTVAPITYSSSPWLHLESSYQVGNQVGLQYDPLLGKLIAWGIDRHSSHRRLLTALREFSFLGIKNNLLYLQQILENSDFISAKIFTNFIDLHHENLVARCESLLERTSADTSKTVTKKTVSNIISSNAGITKDWSTNFRNVGGINNHNQPLSTPSNVQNQVKNNVLVRPTTVTVPSAVPSTVPGTSTSNINNSTTNSSVTSPLPGKIFKIYKQAGDQVKVGETIMSIEAMKMEHSIRATTSAIISKVLVNEGQMVSFGHLLVMYE